MSRDAQPHDLRAVLDTNVLVPASLRDTLLRSAELRLYEPLWTDQILDELRRTLVQHHLTTPEGATRLMAALRATFPAAVVRGHESLVDQMSNAPYIVTLNVRHFLARDSSRFSVTAVVPDAFLSMLFDRSPGTIANIVAQQAASLRRPKSVGEVLAHLARFAPEFVDRVSKYRNASAS